MHSFSVGRHGRRPLRSTATLVLLLAALLPSPARAAKSPVLIDETWTRPDFASVAPRRIAVLPAVVLEGYPSAHPVSDGFYLAVANDGRLWIPPNTAWSALGKSESERIAAFRPIAVQIRNDGRTDHETSQRLAKLLNVDALVILRVDRWEQVSDANELTAVEARGTMVDATGEPLWKIAGRSRVFGKTLRSEVTLPAPAEGTKLVQQVTAAAPSGGGSSSSGSASNPAAGSGASPPPPPTNYTTKIEQKTTPVEEFMRIRGANPLLQASPQFEEATRALMAAWTPKLPAAPARADSTSRPSAGGR